MAKKHEDIAGQCANCGSENIDYKREYLDDDSYFFTYQCQDCEKDGREEYVLEFSTNRID